MATVAVLLLAEHGRPEDRFPPVRINHTTSYYAVQGNSIGRIREQLRHHAPQGMASGHGRTSSRLSVEAQLDQGADGCTLGGLELSVDIVTTLPEWQPAPHAGREVRQQWLGALGRLERHEEGHRRHATEAAHELHAALLRLAPEDDCLRLQTRVDSMVRRATWKLRMRDRFFDERTQDGLLDDASAS
ncbi:DUF922 domain-containing protein [Luteimonas sp. A534]